MEPVTLASTVISGHLPIAFKGIEAFVKQAGKAAFDKAKSLFETLKASWASDNEASQALDHFEQKLGCYSR